MIAVHCRANAIVITAMTSEAVALSAVNSSGPACLLLHHFNAKATTDKLPIVVVSLPFELMLTVELQE